MRRRLRDLLGRVNNTVGTGLLVGGILLLVSALGAGMFALVRSAVSDDGAVSAQSATLPTAVTSLAKTQQLAPVTTVAPDATIPPTTIPPTTIPPTTIPPITPAPTTPPPTTPTTPPAVVTAIQNGSFESPDLNAGDCFVTLDAGRDLEGWQILGQVDLIREQFKPAEGSQSIDLNGLVPGTIRQTVSTVSGTTYVVSMEVAANNQGGPESKDFAISVDADGATPQRYSVDNPIGQGTTSCHDYPRFDQSPYKNVTYTFTASSSATTLTIASRTEGAAGVILDDISVEVA